MSPNKRIFLNIVATYPDRAEGDIGQAKLARRSLYALVIGLFCGRWTLVDAGRGGLWIAGREMRR